MRISTWCYHHTRQKQQAQRWALPFRETEQADSSSIMLMLRANDMPTEGRSATSIFSDASYNWNTNSSQVQVIGQEQKHHNSVSTMSPPKAVRGLKKQATKQATQPLSSQTPSKSLFYTNSDYCLCHLPNATFFLARYVVLQVFTQGR